MVTFDLGPLLQGQTRIAKLKMLITRLLLVLEVWDVKPTYRKSWAGNLLVCSDITRLLLVVQVWDGKPTYRIAKIKSAYNSLIRVPRGL